MGDSVATGYALGVITGVDNSGSFAPKGRMNRTQTAVIYVRQKEVMETGKGISIPSQNGTSTGSSSEGSGENATGTLTTGKPVTEENMQSLYLPFGVIYFGDLPAREFTGHPENIRPGDILHFDGIGQLQLQAHISHRIDISAFGQ